MPIVGCADGLGTSAALNFTFEMTDLSSVGSAAATGRLFARCQSDSLQRENLEWLSGNLLSFLH